MVKHMIATNVAVNTALKSPIRIVQLTDLHNAQFGDDNCELVELVEQQAPDLIVMTGDCCCGFGG